MSSLFNESMLKGLKSIRKGFLWTGVCILIGEVVVAAILILTQKFDLTIGKAMGTFALCALMLFLGVNNFSMMEKDNRTVQGFALVSLICNILWLVLAVLFIWDVIEFTDHSGFFYSSRLTIMAKLMFIAINVAIMSFLISNVWAIRETVKPVRPLKITAIVCELYCGVYGVVMTVGEFDAFQDSRWYALAGLAGFAFIVMAIAASIVSKSGLKKEVKGEINNVNDEATQAAIREMVEKEVQARMAAQNSQIAEHEVKSEETVEIKKNVEDLNSDNDMSVVESDDTNITNSNNVDDVNDLDDSGAA